MKTFFQSLASTLIDERTQISRGQQQGTPIVGTYTDNMVYLGPQAHYRDSDPESNRPTDRKRGFGVSLDLSKDSDKIMFDELTKLAVEGVLVIISQKTEFSQKTGDWMVLIQGYLPFQTGPGQTAISEFLDTLKATRTGP